MPADRDIPGSPEEWLTRAQAALALACVELPPGGVYEDLCYQAQQAAEKAIKAVCQYRGVRFTYTHNLARLLAELSQSGLRIPDVVNDALPLTDYAHETRYPGTYESVSAQEHAQAVRAAEAVVAWAEKLIGDPAC